MKTTIVIKGRQVLAVILPEPVFIFFYPRPVFGDYRFVSTPTILLRGY
ncbi:unnamed protein product [Callosobruchus maculatus]|uniref:Uncharacterized protein n=1 Tax=Callosobruchus maculatus TaxID=64391 RepID=A0A653C1M3_CALMS|nr:unnamed protein product [Callosobruchus maculatus]